MISDLREQFTVNVLKRQPAITDHLAGFLQAYRPQSEAVLLIARLISRNPPAYAHLIKDVRIMPHVFTVGKDRIQRLIILHRHLPKNETAGLKPERRNTLLKIRMLRKRCLCINPVVYCGAKIFINIFPDSDASEGFHRLPRCRIVKIGVHVHGLNPILVTYLQTEVQIDLVVTFSALGRTDAVADMAAVLFKPFIESKADVDHADNLPVIFPNQKEFPCRHSHFVRYHEVVGFRRSEPSFIIL